MTFKNIFWILLAVVVCYACESKNIQLKEEVIAIHDEVMPHMGKLSSLQKEFLERADQLASEDSAAQHELIEQLRSTAVELDAAYDGMFVWMRQFEPEQGERSDEEFNAYLLEQKVLVEKVKLDINNSLEKAEALQ